MKNYSDLLKTINKKKLQYFSHFKRDLKYKILKTCYRKKKNNSRKKSIKHYQNS